MPVELVFIIELIFLIALILGLHYYRPKIGLLPMLFAVMTLTVIVAMSSFLNVFVDIFPQITFRISGHMLVPAVILSILLLYILDGATIARIAFASLLFVSLLTMILMLSFAYYASAGADNVVVSASLESINNITLLRFLHIRIASLSAFAVAILSSIITYQAIRNLSERIPEFISVILALFIGLWLDSLTFFLIKDFSVAILFNNIVEDVIAKSTISLILAIPTTLYLYAINHRERHSNPTFGRPVFSIMFGTQAQFAKGMRDLQSELHVNQQIYQYLTENLNTIIYLADADSGDLIYISPAFEKILGYKVDILENKVDNLLLVVHPDDRVSPPLLDFMIKNSSNTFRIVRRDGEIGWIHNRVQALYDESGEIYRYLGVAEDITEEYERRERALQLQLSQERIRVMNDFVRDASHDLKSPLSSMMMKIDMLERTEGERHLQLQDELRARVKYLAQMIDDLFTLSLFEGNMNAEQDMVNLQALAEETITDLDALAQHKSLLVILETTSENCTIMSSHEAIQRLLNNLISNAIRYTDVGQVTVSFQADNDSVSFTVSDTGIGIPEKDLNQIFDRFYRSKNAKEYNRDGTGLGLAISRAIVENHGGSISVKSEIAVGTSVIVHLPRSLK